MAVLPTTVGLFLCLLVYNVQGTTINMTSVPMATPSLNMSLNMSMINTSMHVNYSVPEILPSIHWINGSCRIVPSTCICDEMMTVNISVMSAMINMTATSEQVGSMAMTPDHNVNISVMSAMINMTATSEQVVNMTMTPDHNGSFYLAPMNSTIHPNMTSNYSAVPCTCYGQYTWCRKNFTVSPTMSGSMLPVNTANSNNNNNDNNKNTNTKTNNNTNNYNNNTNNGIASAIVSSIVSASTSENMYSSVMPSMSLASYPEGGVNATVPLDTVSMVISMSASVALPAVSVSPSLAERVETMSGSMLPVNTTDSNNKHNYNSNNNTNSANSSTTTTNNNYNNSNGIASATVSSLVSASTSENMYPSVMPSASLASYPEGGVNVAVSLDTAASAVLPTMSVSSSVAESVDPNLLHTYSLTKYNDTLLSVSPTTSGSMLPVNTADSNNNNNPNNTNTTTNNNSNYNNNNGIASATVSSLVSASTSENMYPGDGVDATILLDTASMVISISASAALPAMSVSPSVDGSVDPSPSVSVVVKASTTPGGEIVPEPTTLPPVCNTDCAGVNCGTAIVNSCGFCVEGNTGLGINHGKDCNNVCNGTARNDSCGACSNPPANNPTSKVSPFADCNNDCFGSAKIDSCGNCSGGSTRRAADFWKDLCGICGGDNSSCIGCDKVPNSGLIKDSCGICGGNGSTCTNITSVHPSLLPSTSASGRTVTVVGAGLTGDSIKCVVGGEESRGNVVNITICQCAIPNNITVGTKDFTVKVVKGGVETPTANLTIKIYNATSVKITAISPAEFLTATPQSLMFRGVGLEENPAAVCVIRSGTVMKIRAVFQSDSYKCSVPGFEMAKNLTVGLAINGIHELNSDVDLNRKVFATAPNVTSARFTDTGAIIIIEFDKTIATTSLMTCANIFSTGLASLGQSATCTWTDGRHLEISPGVDAAIQPEDSLTFRTDAIKRNQLFSKVMNGSVVISAPANPVKPVPVIYAPTQISSCGHLTLDGSQSSGGGGRNLKYKWILEAPVEAAITLVLDQAENTTKVNINGTLMKSGTTYTFKLVVSNFLMKSMETNVSVTKATSPSPEVTVEGPLQGKALAGNSFYITASAKAASCSVEKALSYSWSVVCTNDDSSNSAKTRAESSPGFKLTSSKSALKIDTGSLVGEKTYEFIVVVSLTASPSVRTRMTTTVVVEWSPLEPAIAGGDRTLGRDSGTFELDAKSSTIDPDNAPGELSCSWTCTDTSNEQPCYSAVNRQSKIILPNECKLTLASNDFEAGKIYKIKSEISKGSRTGSSSMLLTVVEGRPPAVSVITPSMKVIAGEKVNLGATYNSSSKPQVEWISAQEDGYRFIDTSDQAIISSSSNSYTQGGTSFSALVLKPNVLTSGSTYKFIVNVNDGSKVGSSNIVVQVRSGPTSGSFEVEPTTVEQLQEVTLRALRWVTDADANPLEYEFGFLDDTGAFQPWKTQTSNEYTIAVPPGYGPNNVLTLRMKVKDAFGSMKWLDKNITVNKSSSIDESQVESLVDNSLQEAKDSGDYSEVVPNMMNILSVVKNSNSSDNLTAKVMNTTAEALISAVDATLLDEEKAKPILETLLQLDVESLETPKEILDSFEKVTTALDGNLALEKVDKSLKLLEDLAGKCDLNDPEVVEDLVSTDDEIANSLANTVELGNPVVEATSTRCDITAQHSLLIGNISTKSGIQAPQVDFGDEMRTKYGFWECQPGKYCLGVKLTYVNYKRDYYTAVSSTKPGIISSKVVSVKLRNPETGATLPVSGLNDPITISFETGIPSAGKTFKGYYFSESQNKWSDNGLTSTMEGSTLKVTTNHLTSFAPAEEDFVNPTTVPGNNTGTTVAPSAVTVYEVSFVLSNTTWNDTFSNTSHPDHEALKNAILAELNNVYQGDTTLKDIVLDKFEPSGDKVKVLLKMTFDDSNDDPSAKLRNSLSDGKLGSIAVDKDSLNWVDSYAPSESEADEDTGLIIGTVFGVFFGLAFILLGIAYLKNRQSRRKVVSSHPSINEDPQPPEEPDNNEETPA